MEKYSKKLNKVNNSMKTLIVVLSVCFIWVGKGIAESFPPKQAIIYYSDKTTDTIKVNCSKTAINDSGTYYCTKCGKVFSSNVDSVKVFKTSYKNSTIKLSSLFTKQHFGYALYSLAFILILIFYIKSNDSIMKTILKYLAYVVIIILSFKIGMILIQYVPLQIENLFK